MSTVHRTLDGGWAECESSTCKLKFHIPNMTVEEAARLPTHILYPLLEIVDPPSGAGMMFGGKLWEVEENGRRIRHRDYDLPAVISKDGSMEWWYHGERHRGGGKPAVIERDGSLQYWNHGTLIGISA